MPMLFWAFSAGLCFDLLLSLIIISQGYECKQFGGCLNLYDIRPANEEINPFPQATREDPGQA